MESPFYRDLNKALRNNNFSGFNQYIFTLYNGLNRKIIKDFHDGYLYRSSCITINELNGIVNSFCRLVLARTFLSFSKEKKVVMCFLQPNKLNPNLKNILFVVNPLKQKNITVTNMDIEEISEYKDEKEVLFLPFSGFEISNINEGNEYITIYLNYLNKYEKKSWIILMREVKIE